MTLDIRFTSTPLGHEVRGLDVRRLDDATFAQVEAAFDRYGVIVISGQDLTPAEQVAFSRRFGPLDRFVLDRFNLPEQPEVFVVSNIVEDGRPIGMGDAGRYWHSDMWVSETPPRGSILYAREVPHRDGRALGDTCFASTAHAYDTLPERTKARIENLCAVFSSAKYAEYVGHTTVKDVHTREIVAAREKVKDRVMTHRLVRRHPRTGRKCLYVVEGVISHIVGMGEAESEALVGELLQHVVRPEVVYRHNWRVGDMVLWDNYSAVHCAIGDFAAHERRLMHRTTLSCPAPAAAAA